MSETLLPPRAALPAAPGLHGLADLDRRERFGQARAHRRAGGQRVHEGRVLAVETGLDGGEEVLLSAQPGEGLQRVGGRELPVALEQAAAAGRVSRT